MSHSKTNHLENIVEIQNVSFDFGKNEVLKDINLNIHRGDYLGLVGGNGAGKTTLLKIILGLLKPTTGKVKLFGEDINEFKNWQKVGYVPQKATNFDNNFPATVLEVVLMGRYGRIGLFNMVKEIDREKAKQALINVDMWEFKDKLIGDLSGGQQQRVFIARAIASDPEIVFLDEPTVGVELQVKNEFYELLKNLNSKLELTIVLVTHEVENLINNVDHIACVDKTLFFHNSVDQYFKESHPIIHPHS